LPPALLLSSFFMPINFYSFYRAKHKLQDASSVSRNETHTGSKNPFLFRSSFLCPSFLLYFIIPNFSHFCPHTLPFSISTNFFFLALFCPLSFDISYTISVSLNCTNTVTWQQSLAHHWHVYRSVQDVCWMRTAIFWCSLVSRIWCQSKAEVDLLPFSLCISVHSINLPSCTDRDGQMTHTIRWQAFWIPY